MEIDIATSLITDVLSQFSDLRFGFATLKSPPTTMSHYDQWLVQNFYGEMTYLVRHREIKNNLQIKYPNAQSAIVVAKKYVPHPSQGKNPFPHLNIALYAQGLDYHHWLKETLLEIVNQLKPHFPHAQFWVATDSSPILERDLAQQAGLGWFGKNTCLIDRKTGSYFFIGEILTDLMLPASPPLQKSFCGNCSRCMEACPTQALVAPMVLDARRCISYLTIEAKSLPPKDLRASMGSHFFGCDICQKVCPWNRDLAEPYSLSELAIKELEFILDASEENLSQRIKGTALERSKPQGLRRNAIIVATNMKVTQLKPLIEKHQTDLFLKDVVEWSLSELSQNP